MTHVFPSKNPKGQTTMSRIVKLPLLLSAMLVAGLAHAQLAVQSITASSQGGGEVIRIQTNEALKEVPRSFSTQSPARIALDFFGATNGLGRNVVELNQGNLRSASVVEAGDRTRVVLNLNKGAQYKSKLDGNILVLTLEPVTETLADTAKSTTFAPGTVSGVEALKEVDFRRGSDGSGRVIVNLGNSQTGVDIKQEGKGLVVEFLKTSLPEGLRRRLDVTDFGTPVKSVITSQSGDKVRMVVESTGQWEHSAYQSDNQFVLEVREVKPDPSKLTQGSGYSGEKLTLNFQSIEVRSLLQVIADFTNFNIVTSDSVTGNVTLRLKDVPWDQALDIILQAKGLGMRKNNNVIWIAPKDELAAREKADAEAAAQIETLEPLRTQTFRLNYGKAAAIAGQLMGSSAVSATSAGSSVSSTRVLSARGSAVAETRTNQLFVTDVPSKLEQVQELIKALDIPVRQVMIEARIVEADESFGKSIGVKFGFGAKQIGVGSISGSNVLGNIGGTFTQVGAANAMSTITPMVSLPANSLGDVSAPTFAASLFNPSVSRLLALEISALQSDGNGRVVSSPRLITADQIKASIEQGVEIPYQEASSSGAAAVQFKKAALRLEVTPQITPEGGIIMDVEVNKDSVGQILATGVAINTNRIKTQVLVENGGTVVIGGIFKSEENNAENKVPLLGDIPVVGNLFKNRTKQTSKKELLVFLTPRVLSDEIAVR